MSSGGVTSERKGFSMCIADGTPNLKNLDAGEKIDRHYLVPLQIFLDRERFAQWIAEITQKGYAVEGDILIARSILDVDWLRQQKLL